MSAYRSDIDGLRAIAILSVLVYHVDEALLPGGFIGVDVFFVISGYLITRIIAGELAQDRFSLSRFYVRRSRRILPALATVLACTTAAGLLLLPPSDLASLGKSLAATAAFLSNMQFWSEIGYFDTAAVRKPLLHTWSLAVEEQFYLLWPLALWGISKLRLNLRWLVFAALLLSFAASCYAAVRHPPSAFFLLPPRAWELLAGAALALRLLPPPGSAGARNLCGLAGITLIVVGCVALDGQSPFPGWNALYPCLGAALLIWAGEGGDNLVGRHILSARPMVFIGLISYSLYLWHWPLLAFGRITQRGELGLPAAMALALLAVVLATLTWRFVETPLRSRGGAQPAAPILWRYAALSLLMFGAGALLYRSDGLIRFASPAMLRTEQARFDINPNVHCLRFQAVVAPLPGAECVSGAPDAPLLVLWGDSHADSLAPGVVEFAARHGLSTLQLSMAGCPPLLGAEVKAVGVDYGPCALFNRQVIEYLGSESRVAAVMLVARWTLYTENSRFGVDDPGPITYLVDAQDSQLETSASRRAFARALEHTIDRLRATGRPVLVLGNIPPHGINVPDCLARNLLPLSGVLSCNVPASEVLAHIAFADAQVEQLTSGKPGVCADLPGRLFCPGAECLAELDGEVLYANDDHLSAHGARFLTRRTTLGACLGAPDVNRLMDATR